MERDNGSVDLRLYRNMQRERQRGQRKVEYWNERVATLWHGEKKLERELRSKGVL